jgi:hypothetical protein
MTKPEPQEQQPTADTDEVTEFDRTVVRILVDWYGEEMLHGPATEETTIRRWARKTFRVGPIRMREATGRSHRAMRRREAR